MQMDCRCIGVLGGTFNPVHNGHLEIAGSVRETFNLDKVLFIPSGLPPHKINTEVADAEHRLAMVYCATASNPYFEVSELEIDRCGYSYTVDTLGQLKELYGSSCTIFFIIGADIIPELITWKDSSTVFGLCEFIAVLRPGHSQEAFDYEIEQLKNNYHAVIHKAGAPLVDVSSTQIREMVCEGKSIKQFVPDCVEEYITKHGLYQCSIVNYINITKETI